MKKEKVSKDLVVKKLTSEDIFKQFGYEWFDEFEKRVIPLEKGLMLCQTEYDKGGWNHLKSYLLDKREERKAEGVISELEVASKTGKKLTKEKREQVEAIVENKLLLKLNQIVENMTKEKLEAGGLRELTNALALVYDKYRLQTNQSTANTSISLDLSSALRKIDNEKIVDASVVEEEKE